jgi:SAM-dependent methyltransferase
MAHESATRIWTGRLEHVDCNLCGSSTSDQVAALDDSWRLVRCAQCGLVFVNPRPTQADLVAGYKQWGSSEDEAEMSRIRSSTMPALRHERNRIVRSNGQRGSLLDVGSGGGFFLNMMKEAGWNVLGVEPSENLANFATREFGVDTAVGTIESASLPENAFDVVTMWYLLEHVTDPRSVVDRARSLLRDDGLLILRVPNFTFALPFLFLRKLGFDFSDLGVFSTPWHLYFFDRDTMHRLMESCGFRVTSIDHGAPYRGDRAAYNMVKRAMTTGAEILKYASFGHLCWGPAIVVSARRK